jgi:hypothetical protein
MIQLGKAKLDCQGQFDSYNRTMSSDAAPVRPRLTRKGEATRRRIVVAAAELIHE